MNENNKPVPREASVITSVSQSSNTNDCIDLIEINDSDETEASVIVSNNSVSPKQPFRPKRNRRFERNPKRIVPESLDDSICILYENVKPPPEIIFVNEVIVDSSAQNQSADIGLLSEPFSPVIFGSFIEQPAVDHTSCQHTPPSISEIQIERTSNPQQINYSIPANQSETIHHSNSPLPLSYSNAVNEDCIASRLRELPNSSMLTYEKSLNLESVPHKTPSPVAVLENSNIESKASKIQCGICLEGPDEIAASNRNLTSTKCGHIFCNTCIKTSMRNAAKCPKCRKRINSRSIHPLYL